MPNNGRKSLKHIGSRYSIIASLVYFGKNSIWRSEYPSQRSYLAESDLTHLRIHVEVEIKTLECFGNQIVHYVFLSVVGT